MRTTLFVLGMHCSGGGVLANALAQCGAQVAVREGLQALCEGLPQGRPAPICIHIVRNPLEVAQALQASRKIEVAEGLALWEAYNVRALRASKGLARALVLYSELVAYPHQCLAELLCRLDALGIQKLELPQSQVLNTLIHPHADDGDQATDGDDRLLSASQSKLWRQLSIGRLDGEVDPHRVERESLKRALRNRADQVGTLKTTTREQASEIVILNQRLAWLDAQVMEFQASSSWRITAPLRLVSTTLRKLRIRLAGSKGRLDRPGRAQPDAANAPARPSAILEGEDKFVLYRIIGNDLYPRHKRGQATENLKFILEHEPAFEACEKRFVVNRILDASQEREIIALLERAGFEYIRIPFESEEYARARFDTDILPEPNFLVSERFEALDGASRSRLFAALYRHKNNYVMNNNGARNAALEEGRTRGKWVLPWDGNCFLTRQAWETIRQDIAKAPENRYFIVPMARMPDNDLLINDGEIPRAVEEPQIIFRTDASEIFDSGFCYGRRPKVELLWRLGVMGPWDEYPDDPWDQQRSPVSPDAVAVGRAGWVARLSSGMTTLDADSDQAPLHRGLARSGAILTTLQHLDAKLAGMDSDEPVSIHSKVLRREIKSQDVPPLKALVGALRHAADEALVTREVSLQDALDDSLVLSLAWSFTGAAPYAERGAEILEYFFINPDTRAAPDSSSEGMFYYLDAVRIFESAGSLREPTRTHLRSWLRARMQWLATSSEGAARRRATDHRGTFYDLEVASIATYLDDQEVVYDSLIRAQSRIEGQFSPDGSPLGEITHLKTAHRCCFNFQIWISLAELASRWGMDLWGYLARNGSGLRPAAQWLISQMDKPWPCGPPEGFDAERFQPILFAVQGLGIEIPRKKIDMSLVYGAKAVFDHGNGIRPFWNLGSYG